MLEFVLFLSSLCSKTAFIDLADNYIPARLTGKMHLSGTAYSYQSYSVAITRTLLGYVIDPSLATILCESSKHFSLPIDMHYQKVFCEMRISGFRPATEILRHGSKYGSYQSSLNY